MKRIAEILALLLALGLVGCKSSEVPKGNTDASNTKVEDKSKVDDKNKIEDQNKVHQQSKKQEYKTKLDNIETELKYLDKKEASGTTADMRAVANERYEKWDAALNEIYGVLKEQLSASDMKNLQSEEIQWISNRDAKAENIASEMKGGTMEPVLYTGSLASTTKARCYELVEKYMQ